MRDSDARRHSRCSKRCHQSPCSGTGRQAQVGAVDGSAFIGVGSLTAAPQQPDGAAALLGDDPAGDATVVLAGIEVAWRAGELDIAEATLLRARALEGRRAWVQARAEVAEARIAAALAEGSATLIP